MIVERVEVLVEEPSMEAALRVLLPRILHNVPFGIYQHQCKSELLARLSDRLHGYAAWIPPSWRIVVLVDRDADDCKLLKQRLEKIAADARLPTRNRSKEGLLLRRQPYCD
jgi:hypothetical protein